MSDHIQLDPDEQQSPLYPKTCFTCKHYVSGRYNGYWEPPDPSECTNEDLPDDLFTKFNEMHWEETAVAPICPHFDPLIVEKCGCCSKELNIPEYRLSNWAFIEDAVPVCSAECKHEVEKQFKKRLQL